jgi:hypothetical protein
MDSAVFETVSTEKGPTSCGHWPMVSVFFNSHLLHSRPRVHYRTANIWKLKWSVSGVCLEVQLKY